MQFTQNPIGSDSQLDLSDNAIAFDYAMNSPAALWTDRFGKQHKTVQQALKDVGFKPAGFDFVTGGTLGIGDRDKCVFYPTDGYWYSWNGKLPYMVPANASPTPSGKKGWGPVIKDEQLLAREALRRTYASVGLNLAAGSFETGGTLTSASDVLLHEVSGKVYGWGGTFPKVTAAGDSPSSSAMWLRADLFADCGTYADLRAFSGTAVRAKVLGRTNVFDKAHGEFYIDMLDKTSPDNDGTIIVDALGRRWKRQYSGLLDVSWFGAIDDYDVNTGVGSDNLPAFQKAIAACNRVTGTELGIFVSGKAYYLSSELSIVSTITDGNYQGLRIVGASRTTEFKNGTRLYFGGGKVGVNTNGTDGVVLENIAIMRAKTNGARVGLLQARTVGPGQTGWAGDQRHINLYINMFSDTSYPDGFGTIGYINLGAEETAAENLQIWANTPVIFSSNKTVLATKDNLTSNKTLDVQSLVSEPLETAASNTVFELYGLSRLIAYDFVSPCLLVNNAATLRLGNTFMQKRTSGIEGSSIGTNNWALETWNCFGFEHFGAVESCKSYHLQRRAFTDFDINVVLSVGEVGPQLATWMYKDDGGSYIIERGRAVLRNNNVSPVVSGARNDGVTTSELNLSISDWDLSYNQEYNGNSIDRRILRKMRGCKVTHNGKPIIIDDIGSFKARLPEVNIGNNASVPVKLFDVLLPSYLAGYGSVSGLVTVEGRVSNVSYAGGPASAVGGPSSAGFRSSFAVSRGPSSTTITVGDVSTAFITQASTLPGGNNITNITISLQPVDASGLVGVYAHCAQSGANGAHIYLSGDIKIEWAGGLSDSAVCIY